MSWRSFHLFLADPDGSDALLRDMIGPDLCALVASGQARSWFFIRYWENGPHLRVRIAAPDAQACAALLARWRNALPRYLGSQHALPAAYPDDMVFERSDVDAAARRWLPQGTLREIPYEPELARYGGAAALPISEDLFAASSALALDLIAARPPGGARQSAGLLLTCVALAAATPDGASLLAFLQQMKRTWRAILGDVAALEREARQIPLAQRQRYLDLIAHLQNGGAAPAGATRQWWQQLRDATARWRALGGQCPLSVAALLDSHIHMMNNRLGLSPAVEYWFAHLLADTLAHDTNSEIAMTTEFH